MNPFNIPTQTMRRHFVKGASILAGGAFAEALSPSCGVHAAGTEVLKVGLIGCGGRGTGAATQALMADTQVKLVAMADVFEDRLTQSLKSLHRSEGLSSKIDVPTDRQFVGFDAYQHVLASGCGSSDYSTAFSTDASASCNSRRQACLCRKAMCR